MAFNPARKTFCNAKAKATAKGKGKVKAQAKAKAKAKANAKAKAKPKAKVKAQAKAKAKEARSAEKILLLQNWRAQRGGNFATLVQVTGQVRLGVRFLWYLARAARRKILQAMNLQKTQWSGQTGSPVFSGIWRAQRGENFAFATPARAARRKIVQAMNLQKTQW